ncbi:DUF7519 family protein [Natrialba taiwanensis]|uniref:Uncharacterized protein n=1 Tax=Natrialba taiwanensis DSM 12281 TaxID=1230458 RepID=M0A2Y0_9EURY|nr:hypothetical protein [Natrialba taiwanensis]ELY92671.1 hypothetical protein C484_08583 [Natrialba taiwanensis DSM 12281]
MSGLPDKPTDPTPASASAGVAFVAVFGACIAGSTDPRQTAPLLLEAIGLTLLIGGGLLRRRRYRLVGSAVTGFGFIVATVALGASVTLSLPLSPLLILLASGSGTLLVTLGVFPVYGRFARSFTTAGVALVFAGVTATALIDGAPLWRSTVAVTMVLLSWDTAERAVTLGERVGGAAETRSVELAGAMASSGVALIAIILTIAVSRIPAIGSSIGGLALLLVATTTFLLALAHFPQMPTPRQ